MFVKLLYVFQIVDALVTIVHSIYINIDLVGLLFFFLDVVLTGTVKFF